MVLCRDDIVTEHDCGEEIIVRIAVILTSAIEFNTSSMIRCRQIMNEFAKQGHSVICCASNPDQASRYFDPDAFLDNRIEVMRYGPTNVRKSFSADLSSNPNIKKRLVQVIYKAYKRYDLFGYSIRFLKYREEIKSYIEKMDCDVVVSFSHPITAHIIAGYCAERLKIRYIQQWGDPLTLDFTDSSHCPKVIKKRIEYSTLKKADRICYVSPLTLKEQKQLFPSLADRMVFIPTPSLPFEEDPCQRTNRRLCIGYYGSYHSIARDIRPFYEAAREYPEIDFKIIGDSDIVLEEQANIEICPRVSQKQLADHVRNTDVLVCLMNHHGNQIPGKIYHDAASTKDILLIKDGENGDEIERFFAQYEHYTFVNNTVNEIRKMFENYLTYGVPSRKQVEDFSAQNVAMKLIAP